MPDHYQKNYKAYTEKLTQSILAKAFRAEFVPQDPSASELLNKIKAEREKQQAELKDRNGPRQKAKQKKT
jgi:type I restriction enzyme, S subunit